RRCVVVVGAQCLRCAGDQIQGDDVVGGASVSQRAGAAGVVAEHAAEGAAAVRRGVRTEPQPVRGGGGPQIVEDHSGLHDRGAQFGIDVPNLVEVPGEVDHDAGTDGVAGDRGSGTASG